MRATAWANTHGWPDHTGRTWPGLSVTTGRDRSDKRPATTKTGAQEVKKPCPGSLCPQPLPDPGVNRALLGAVHRPPRWGRVGPVRGPWRMASWLLIWLRRGVADAPLLEPCSFACANRRR